MRVKNSFRSSSSIIDFVANSLKIEDKVFPFINICQPYLSYESFIYIYISFIIFISIFFVLLEFANYAKRFRFVFTFDGSKIVCVAF